MSIEKIIQESINKNPLAMKEALEEELRSRLALALEAKMNDMDDEDDEDDEDMDESFDLSDLTLEELEDFMVSEDFDQLDEMSKRIIGGQRSAKMGAASDPSERIVPKRGTKAYAAWAAKNAERRKAALAKQKNESFDLDEANINHGNWESHHHEKYTDHNEDGDDHAADLHRAARDAHSKAKTSGAKSDSKRALELSRKARNTDNMKSRISKRVGVGAMGKVG